MGLQKFIARERFTFANDAIGYAPGGPFDCLGPYAKVENCPIAFTTLRRTVYATGYADTFFSIPAACVVKGKTVRGYLCADDSGDGRSVEFRPYVQFDALLGIVRP